MSGQLLQDAIAAHQAGNLADAERQYRRVLQTQPRNCMALHLLSSVAVAQGKLAEALRLIRRATSLCPEQVESWLLQAEILVRQGQLPDALASLDRALALRPGAAEAWVNRGSVLARMGRHAAALEAFERALALDPASVQALANRGLALLELKRPAEALEVFEHAVAARPRDPDAANHRGLALQALDRHEGAVAAFDDALRLAPGHADAWNHRGVSLQALGRASAALDSYGRAIALQPDDPWFHWNAGLCRLLMGDYAGGWPEYEWRLRALPPPPLDKRPWQGEPLDGRTLLLHTEQGLGDIIQFCRFAPLVSGTGRVILQVPAVLVELLRSLNGGASGIGESGVAGAGSRIASGGMPAVSGPARHTSTEKLPRQPGSNRAARVEIVPAGTRPPRFDLHCPLLSLPARLGTVLRDVSPTIPYLRAPAAPRFGTERTIGICWQGNPDVRIDPERSVPLRWFAAVAAVPGVKLVSLQKRHGLDQLADLPGVTTLGPDGPADFMATAAAIEAVDLVISSDTVVAHLAGALGRPVWLATSFVPDWRWGLSGNACPWYPTMRLFRQPRRGDWASVFAAMADALLA